MSPQKTVTSPSEGKVYLLVVDTTEEFSVAVDYAADMAVQNDARLALLNVIEVDHFDHWQNIEDRIRKEMRSQAESMVWEVSKRIMDRTDCIPMVCIEEGNRGDVIVETINRDPNICLLILGGAGGASGPGPLVSYFSGKGLHRLRVPLVIIPDHLSKVAAGGKTL